MNPVDESPSFLQLKRINPFLCCGCGDKADVDSF